jgi:hypothetical protein
VEVSNATYRNKLSNNYSPWLSTVRGGLILSRHIRIPPVSLVYVFRWTGVRNPAKLGKVK